jgi:putative membrane protein
MRRTLLHTLVLAGASFCLQYSVPVFAQNPSGTQPGGPPSSSPTQPGAPNSASPGMPGTMPQDQGGTSATNKADDKKFAKEAAIGGMAEVELGKLAEQKASSDPVKQFGQRMVTDHSKANDELKEVASKENLEIPTSIDSKHQKQIDKLGKLSGADFDRAYVKEMLKDHKKDVKEFQNEAQNGTNPGVKNFAAKTLPVLQEHLEMVQNLSKSGSSTPTK